MVKVFSAVGCGRCKLAEKALKEKGYEVEIHSADYHSLPNEENWRDRPEDFHEFMAQLIEQQEELPVMYDTETKQFILYEELMGGA